MGFWHTGRRDTHTACSPTPLTLTPLSHTTGLHRGRGAAEGVRGAPASTGEEDSDGKGGARLDSPWVQGYDTQWGCFYYYNNVTEVSSADVEAHRVVREAMR